MAFGKGKTFLKGLDGFTAAKKTSMFLRMMCGLAPNGKEVALPVGGQVEPRPLSYDIVPKHTMS